METGRDRIGTKSDETEIEKTNREEQKKETKEIRPGRRYWGRCHREKRYREKNEHLS
ncbi:hypothetical protein GCM10010917_36330 [Paenibacillus physcomitrellae]|uniref:Uncharacterized protein n=1 Tax=Paenibacillus physcomitrellae TaxID=1619311 RepID=A0ABQ1GPS3_9BACL|nr:hypothetical protein GCM10010917_36330 [Paenibacillus physcomitrellae]